MMSKQNNIPQLRFQEFKDEIKEMKFGKVVQSNIYGPRFNANDYSDFGNVKTIRGTDLGSDGEIKYDQVPLALLDEKMVNTHKLLEGDIVMITTAECGATGVYRKQEVDFLSSAYGVRLRLNEKGYPYYFKYFFQTHQAKKEINSYIRKSTIANLPGSDILRIKVFLPTIPEQQKIASFLSTVDEKIQQLSRKKELLSQYKKGVMQQLFSGKLRFKDENGKDYSDWEEKKLGEIARITTGSSNRQDSNLDGDYTFFDRSQDIRSSNIFLFDTEAIIVPGEGQEFTPKYFIGKFDLHQRTYAVMDFGVNMGKFLFFYIGYHSNHLNSHAVGSTVKSLRLPMFEKMPIKLPSIPEQQKIATFLSSVDAKIESANQQINQTQCFKKGLLQQMFC
jgi:type I restriction enzyme S subunit